MEKDLFEKGLLKKGLLKKILLKKGFFARQKSGAEAES